MLLNKQVLVFENPSFKSMKRLEQVVFMIKNTAATKIQVKCNDQ